MKKNNKKLTPEQVQQEIRKKLSIEEFVTSRQVKSLYSRWAKLLKQGKLNVLENEDGNGEVIENDVIENDDDLDLEVVQFNKFIQEQATCVINQIEDESSILFRFYLCFVVVFSL